MKLEVQHINRRLVLVAADSLETTVMNHKQSLELAKNLIEVVNELMRVENNEK